LHRSCKRYLLNHWHTQIYPPVKTLNIAERKRILVTGGAGFVGSHLVDKLMQQGHEVTVIDNYFTGRKSNVEHWCVPRNCALAFFSTAASFLSGDLVLSAFSFFYKERKSNASFAAGLGTPTLS
jgi:putative NADH-flavin reductase